MPSAPLYLSLLTFRPCSGVQRKSCSHQDPYVTSWHCQLAALPQDYVRKGNKRCEVNETIRQLKNTSKAFLYSWGHQCFSAYVSYVPSHCWRRWPVWKCQWTGCIPLWLLQLNYKDVYQKDVCEKGQHLVWGCETYQPFSSKPKLYQHSERRWWTAELIQGVSQLRWWPLGCLLPHLELTVMGIWEVY